MDLEDIETDHNTTVNEGGNTNGSVTNEQEHDPTVDEINAEVGNKASQRSRKMRNV